MSYHSSSEGKENYEKRDIWPGLVWIFLAGLAGFIAAGVLMGYASYAGLDFWFKKQEKPLPPMMRTDVLPPEPRLQSMPSADLEEFQKSQQEILRTYAWVDAEKGTVRVPITRAMEILVEKQGIKKHQEGSVEP